MKFGNFPDKPRKYEIFDVHCKRIYVKHERNNCKYKRINKYKVEKLVKVREVKLCTSKQIVEQAVLIINIEKYSEDKNIQKVALPIVGPLHAKALTFDGSTHGWLNFTNLKLLHVQTNEQRKRNDFPATAENTYCELIKAGNVVQRPASM